MIYTETQGGSFTSEDGMSIPNEPANRHYQQMQAEVLAGESTITPYAGSQEELDAAVTAKQQEVSQEFSSISRAQGYAVGLDEMTVYGQIIDDMSTPRAELVKLKANADMAAIAIVFIDALGSLAAVNAYDAVADPGWQL
jgi:hypothetical protein